MIERTVTRTEYVAETYFHLVDDEPVVKLSLSNRTADLTPAEARQLAAELIAEADRAEADVVDTTADADQTISELHARHRTIKDQ